MSRFQGQTIQIAGNNIVHVGSPSQCGETIGGVVDLALAGMQALQDWGVRRQANQAIAGLGAAISQMLRTNIGVLVQVAIEERVRPGGAVERNFRSAFIAGSGRNAREALNEFMYGPRLWATPPPGFTRRESFTWITSY